MHSCLKKIFLCQKRKNIILCVKRLLTLLWFCKDFKNYSNFLKSKVDHIHGHAKMTDDGKVEVGGNVYEADQILIATGGHAVIPDTPGAEHGITSDGFFDLEDLPK